MTIGDVPISMIGARSFSVSNGRFGNRLGLAPWVSNTNTNVAPSGGDVTAACVPIAPDGAGAVFDYDRRFQVLLEQRLNAPRDRVGGSARRKRHNDANRFRRPGLCTGREGMPERAAQSDREDRE